MGYWGWRPLLFAFCLSVWISGCVATQEAVPLAPPTELPAITLFLHTPTQLSTQTSPGLPLLATLLPSTASDHPAAGATDDITLTPIFPTPTPVHLLLPTPTCYEVADGGILCLGSVGNNRPYPTGRVALQVIIIDSNSQILRRAETTIEQRQIPRGQSAPYRVVFPAQGDYLLAQRFSGVSVMVLRAERIEQEPRRNLLEIGNDEGRFAGGRYTVSFDLYNPARNGDSARFARIVATLFDREDRVLGYRIKEVEAPAAGESRAVQIEIVPVTGAVPDRHTLYVETE